MTGRRGTRPDLDLVLGGLKDFQRDSVEYVFRRLYLDPDATRRFLLADEVGLGKTMVTKGVIARAVDYLWELGQRIDVIYICSNADIARQNLNRLRLSDDADAALASRITLLPTTIKGLKKRRLNFISFTPGTSFDLRSSLGIVEERVLLYWLLREAWEIDGKGALNVLQGEASVANFRAAVRGFRRGPYRRSIDRDLAESYAAALTRRIASEKENGQVDIRTRFEDLCRRFGRARKHTPGEDREDRARMVGELRGLLASTCLKSLEPDLIILDEFQRFKHLLDGKDPASMLARGLFECPGARVLLVSATPYKMYTLDHESEDNHYQDFLRTVQFLALGMTPAPDFHALVESYRRELLRLAGSDGAPLRMAKDALERELRRVIVRTERLALTEDRDGMLRQVTDDTVAIRPEDLRAYLATQKAARALDQGDTLEYWKSSPYLFNFMDDYKLKQAFDEAHKDTTRAEAVAEGLAGSPALLDWQAVASYAEIGPANARLRSLLASTVGKGAWRLLWVPPALPYYRLGGPYGEPKLQQFTKRLVFSSWKVVPKVIATLVSYDAERLMIRSFDDARENSTEARKRQTALLRFGRGEGRLTGMPVLGLIYPSSFLAREFDPLALAGTGGETGELPTQEQLVHAVRERLERLLRKLPSPADEPGPGDDAWYWAAPILLDLRENKERTGAWLGQRGLPGIWSGQGDVRENSDDATAWAEHVARAKELIGGSLRLGPKPRDLSLVLAQMAIAGPGVAALRALARVAGGGRALKAMAARNAAAQVAWSFLHLFNAPEAMALIRGTNSEEPYWRRVLEYCVDGGLQSTLDEYAHVLRESLGVLGRPSETIAAEVALSMRKAIGLRTARLRVDEVRVDRQDKRIEIEPRSMRASFALRFDDDGTEDGGEPNRRDQVREAFNSPFWPFVLATTSVGQEGLDFHQYCHAVVHWNLPSNPVDLEQREGRVHRYKGHAIRRNLARTYGNEARALGGGRDPWDAMFGRAQSDRPAGATDLMPFWLLPVEGGAKIERHVPALPLSRDLQRLEDLRRSLAVYRMVFGQARQEELIAFLITYLGEAEATSVAAELRIDLAAPRFDGAADPVQPGAREAVELAVMVGTGP